jgi:HlyD family secretion protein
MTFQYLAAFGRLTPVALTLAACSTAGGNADAPASALKVGVAGRGIVQVTIEETGVVEPERRIVVKSPISGVVRDLPVQAGDAVRAGQVLAVVVPDIAQANALAQLRSEHAAARIAVDNLRREYDRARELQQRNLTSEADLETRRTALEQAENQFRAAAERMALMESSGVRATNESQTARITAPAAGVVLVRGVEIGETVVGGTSAFGGGTELFTIADLSTLLVKAAINEVDVGKVARGDTVRITVDAFPGDTARGVVRLVPPAARQQDRIRVFDVEVVVTANARLLRPGMTANVSIAGPVRDDALRIPVEAVFFVEGQPTAYRVSGGVPAPTPLTLGLTDLAYVEILDGLAEGDSIALEDPAVAARRAATRRR